MFPIKAHTTGSQLIMNEEDTFKALSRSHFNTVIGEWSTDPHSTLQDLSKKHGWEYEDILDVLTERTNKAGLNREGIFSALKKRHDQL